MSEHVRFAKHSTSCSFAEVKKQIIQYQRRKFNVFQENIPAHLYGVRVETMNIQGENIPYRRVFVKCRDSGDYTNVGWVLNEDCNYCMICQKGLTAMKHHC